MRNVLKERFKLYFHGLSGDNAEKTSIKVTERFVWEQRMLHTEQLAMRCQEKGVSDTTYFSGEKVIVSLTTYGKRLYEVYLTIESIMQQTVKPNRIILWLQDDLQNTTLPIMLQKQMARGLEIGFCKDIKSYKKLIPSLHKFPDDIIVTIDDDIIFSVDMLENLLISYQKNPQYVHTNRAHIMKVLDEGTFDKYLNWKLDTKQVGMSPFCFPTGGAGTLYPPHSLSEEVFNEEVFLALCPKGDDIWFKAMSLLNGTKSYKAFTHDPYLFFNPNVQDISLWKENIHGNDIQLQKVFCHYKLYDKLF